MVCRELTSHLPVGLHKRQAAATRVVPLGITEPSLGCVTEEDEDTREELLNTGSERKAPGHSSGIVYSYGRGPVSKTKTSSMTAFPTQCWWRYRANTMLVALPGRFAEVKLAGYEPGSCAAARAMPARATTDFMFDASTKNLLPQNVSLLPKRWKARKGADYEKRSHALQTWLSEAAPRHDLI